MNFREYDLVKTVRRIADHGIAEGAVGTVVMVYDDPLAYEVEFVGEDGATVALATLNEGDLVPHAVIKGSN